jgi:hypothetical protein
MNTDQARDAYERLSAALRDSEFNWVLEQVELEVSMGRVASGDELDRPLPDVPYVTERICADMRDLQAISVKVSEEAAGTLSCGGTTLRLASGLAAIDLDDRTCSVIDVEGEPGGCLERAGEQGPVPDRALPHWLAIVENQSNGCRVEGYGDDDDSAVAYGFCCSFEGSWAIIRS